MKTILFFISALSIGPLFAQPTLINQAIVYTNTTVEAPDETEDVSNIPSSGEGGSRMSFRNFGDGEYKSVTYLKNNQVKTVIKSEMGRGTILVDNEAKKSTILMEMMGNKTGYVVTEADRLQMQQRMDSTLNAMRKKMDSGKNIIQSDVQNEVLIEYVNESKKIAGFDCKKALLISKVLLGIKDTIVVWYNPQIKLNHISNTGGTSVMAGIVPNSRNVLSHLEKIDGFPMSYQSRLPRKRVMTVEVTKIDFKKEIDASEFDIPKGFEIKPFNEAQGGMQLRTTEGKSVQSFRLN